MANVTCGVDTCTHWIPGHLCGAKEIDIMNEEEALAVESPHTMCKTFAYRETFADMLGSLDNVNWSGAVSEPFMEGRQLTPHIMCNVETCNYWGDGNLCHAEVIKVRGNHANECQDTDCETFTPARR